jgi:hypothetical protein
MTKNVLPRLKLELSWKEKNYNITGKYKKKKKRTKRLHRLQVKGKKQLRCCDNARAYFNTDVFDIFKAKRQFRKVTVTVKMKELV